jgi:hypothetical protein
LDFVIFQHGWQRAGHRFLDDPFGRVDRNHTVLMQPAKECLDGSDPAGKGFRAARDAPAFLHPAEEIIQVCRGDGTQSLIRRQVSSQ